MMERDVGFIASILIDVLLGWYKIAAPDEEVFDMEEEKDYEEIEASPRAVCGVC